MQHPIRIEPVLELCMHNTRFSCVPGFRSGCESGSRFGSRYSLGSRWRSSSSRYQFQFRPVFPEPTFTLTLGHIFHTTTRPTVPRAKTFLRCSGTVLEEFRNCRGTGPVRVPVSLQPFRFQFECRIAIRPPHPFHHHHAPGFTMRCSLPFVFRIVAV